MNLKLYLESNHIHPVDFAKAVQVTPRHLEQIIKKRTNPSKKLAKKIVKASNSKVETFDLMM